MEIKIYSFHFVKKILNEHNLLKCEVCGFDQTIDLCHIISHKEGGAFDIDSNLLILCPNHHRLFDSGQLKINPKKILKSRTWKFGDLLKPDERIDAENADENYKKRVEEAVEVMTKREKDLEKADLTKRGWAKEISVCWGVSPRQVKRFMEKYFPEHLEKAWGCKQFHPVNRLAFEHAQEIIKGQHHE